ncbi:hypothetical protein PCANC_17902 [Puccinia coronata f. sp. avenae]|uniref:Reverse transcriptase domain-containing protein n=1 Tax=Puccinia coronata f. sp. avenae TaxID=200324 RepID=A0A2N5UDX4_9BASI|nr:hypothetical protein PCANC_17902 [Puccinia coronata f. sp. avenae]
MSNHTPILTPNVSSSPVVDSQSSFVPCNEEFSPSSIVQLNCHNSRATTYSILNSEPDSVFILLLQEPWINPLTCLPPDHESWWTVYSPEHQPANLQDKHRAASYVRKTVASSNLKTLPGGSKFLNIFEVLMLDGLRLRAINLYVQPGSTTGIDQLGLWLKAHNNRQIATVMGMDSNLHHHSWNPPGYYHVHQTAKSLASLKGSKTTIDPTWANVLAARRVLLTATTSDNHGSDHQKLVTCISTTPATPTYQVVVPRAVELDKTWLRKAVQSRLPQLSPLLLQLPVDEAERQLTAHIFDAWQEQGKKTRVNHFRVKRWWDKATLDPLVKTRNKCRRLLVMHPTPENTERFNYWNGNSPSRAAGGILPLRGLDGKITSNKEDQAKLLFEGTSVVHNECDLRDIPPADNSFFVVYPAITQQEVLGVLGRLAKKKAAGPDHIPNEVLSLCAPDIADALTTLFNRCIREGVFPLAWRSATTTIIRKFNKPDYTSPGAYRPIALLSTLSKTFETVLANRLTFWAESRKALPEGHSGGRRGKGCKDAMMALTMWVRRKWREGYVVTALFLNVKSAYPSVHPWRLVHSLRQKGRPAYLWRIITAFLEDQTTCLRLADYLSAEFHIDQGLPQGCPLSVMLYILYNADLLIPKFDFDSDAVSLGFINDVVHLTAGKRLEDATRKLSALGDASLTWGKSHGAIFDSKKAQYMVFTHTRSAKSPFLFDGQMLEPQKEVKWLGIWFDEKLTFGKQHTQVRKKANNTIGQLCRIGGSRWGIREQERGLLISSVLFPRVLYSVQVWCTSANWSKVTQILGVIEYSAARFALGVLKSTPVKYLNRHRPFKPLLQAAQNRITNFFLSKLFRCSHKPSAIKQQIRMELSHPAKPFPSPVHAKLNAVCLAEAASKTLESINYVLADRPPWHPARPLELVVD